MPEPSEARVLAVLLHAYNHSPDSLARVAAEVKERFEGSDVWVPPLPVATFSWSDPDQIAGDIVDQIDRRWDARPGGAECGQIILIGHSLGAVLARKVWALAHGATPSGEVDPGQARPWASCIKRIILLAALNRGWMISSALDPKARLTWTIGTAWGNFCRHVLRREPMVFGFRRGAPFLTTTRLQCLAVAKWLRDRGNQLPVTVQLLGTDDDYVAPTDNVDLATGQEFYYLEVKEATHRSIVTLEEGDSLSKFRAALTAGPDALREEALALEDIFDLFEESADDYDATMPAPANQDVRHLVFVVHGIRDRGFWTRRIARRIKKLARARGRPCRSVTSTYGYFPMGPFLTPWIRRTKVEWLLDQYVTAKSLYPEAGFAYVGHSNGTYLLAKGLELCPAMRFPRVVFAGSVVRCRYDWRRFLPGGAAGVTTSQVERIVNYVATADWVVAIFPQGLERLRLPDLGGAGHRGFVGGADLPITNVEHVEGGHGAALAAQNWDDMAKFVLGGPDPRAQRGTAPSRTVAWLGLLAPLIWLLLLALVIGLGIMLLMPLGSPGWFFALLFALYLSLLRIVATKA